MNEFIKPVEIRWSDMDPNFHVRHSVYYDWGAYSRISFMDSQGITPAQMVKHHIGPIIFREECLFKSEVRFDDNITIDLKLTACTADLRKWSMQHQIWKAGNVLAAVISLDGAWMDTQFRKVTAPPEFFRKAFEEIPKPPGFSPQ